MYDPHLHSSTTSIIRLVRTLSGVAVLRLGNRVLLLCLGIMIARYLGPNDYGAYTFVFSLIALISIPISSGIPALVVRETAKYQLKSQWALLRGLLICTNMYVVSASVVVVTLGGVVAFYMSASGFFENLELFLWSLCLIPFLGLSAIRAACIEGFRNITASQIPENVVRPVGMLVLLVIALSCGVVLTPVLVVQFQIAALFLAFIVGVIIQTRVMPKEVSVAKSDYNLPLWVKTVVPFFIFAGLKAAETQITLVLLGVLGNFNAVGLYRIADQGAALVTLSLVIINVWLAPNVARLYHAGAFDELQKVITISARLIFLSSVPVALVFICYGDTLIEFVFGVDFIEGYLALVILCIGQLVNICVGSVALILNMTGNEKETVRAMVVALLVSIVLNVVLIPNFDEVGAAMASAISLSCWNIILLFHVYKKLGIQPLAFFVSKKL